MTDDRYDVVALRDFARDLFLAAGLSPNHAGPVAFYLVEADLMGHDTHGLALAPWYLQHIADGTVACEGEPETISDRGAAVAWRGRWLPGAFLTVRAIDLAVKRARSTAPARSLWAMRITSVHWPPICTAPPIRA